MASICGRNGKAGSLTIKGKNMQYLLDPSQPQRASPDPRLQTLVQCWEMRPCTHTSPTTGTEACGRSNNNNKKRERERTGHTAHVGWWQEPVRNARRPGLILTRDSSQIRVRVACSAGSEKAGQPPSGFVATTPAALHGVAANCPSASPRRLRPR